MTLEQNLSKLEGEIYPVEIQLNAADGPVDSNIYEVYGAAEAGRSRVTFAVETTEKPGVYLMTIPALSFHKNPYWDYQVCARRTTTGHEWLLMQGQIKLRYRIADVPDVKVGATQQTFTATISADSLSVEVHEIAGVKGDRGFSAYEVACQNGFIGTEKEWLDSLRHEAAQEAVEAVKPHVKEAKEARDTAREYATNAEQSKEAAHSFASEAEDCQSVAHEYMDTAKEYMDTAKEYMDTAKAHKDAAAQSETKAATAQETVELTIQEARAALEAAYEAQIFAEVSAMNALGVLADAYDAQIQAEVSAMNAIYLSTPEE